MTFREPVIQRREQPRFIPGTNQGRVGSTGIDVQFGGPGQWRTYDWPLPKPFPYPNHLRTHLQNVNTLLIGKDVQFGAAGQFKTYDWPLPKPPVYPGPLRTWTLNAQVQLIGKDTFFDGPGKAPTYEWTTRVAPRFIQAPTQGRVTGPDTFFGAPGEAPVYDWPTPKSAVIPGKTWTYSLNQTTLAPIIQANPFFQTDWPLPRTTPYQNSLRTALDWFTFSDLDTFFGGAGQPPANMDWPLPRSGVVSGKTWTLSLNQTTLAPSIQSPFSQADWPIPKAALYPAQNRTWLDQVKLNLIGQDQFFAEQGRGPTYDWPLPRTAIRLQDYTWANNLSQSTLAPFIAPMPFNLYDWPTPRTQVPLVDLHSLIQNSGFPDQIPPPLPPTPPVVTDVFSGGWEYARRARKRREDELRLEREQWGILPKAAQIISAVAIRQADALGLDAQQRLEELERELELAGVQYRTRYLELLNLQRQKLIDAEIKGYFEAQEALDEENKRRLMLLLAFLS